MSRLQTYYRLTKPGIIYGNSLTLVAGFLFASRGHVYGGLLVSVLTGSALVIASACVINNVLDRRLDSRMQRTAKRATVTGAVAVPSALGLASVLGVIGIGLLVAFTNTTTWIIGLVGFVDYIVFYGFTKRRSVHGTLVGCISGATPIIAGYTAVSRHFDGAALLLGLLLVFWQLAHFYAIALYRRDDYAAAGLPVFPVVHTFGRTQLFIMLNIVGFAASGVALSVLGYANFWFAGIVLLASAFWVSKGLRTGSAVPAVWGKQMFLRSLLIIMGFAIVLPFGKL